MRDIPYIFMRFLVRREADSARARAKGTLAVPIVVQPASSVADVLRLFRRGRYHLVYVLGEEGRIERVVPEESVITSFFRSGGQNRAVSDLFG